MSGYRAPAAPAQAELREKGSRFLAIVVPAADESAARRALQQIERHHPDATHRCWAWRLGSPPRERSSDAGEPLGTAGQPILRALRGAELSDALAVVVRWFGGTKLGKGGLARAYAAAAAAAVERLETARRVPLHRLRISVPYELVGAVKRLVHPPAVEIAEEDYAERASLTLEMWEEERGRVEAALADLGIEPLPDPEGRAG